MTSRKYTMRSEGYIKATLSSHFRLHISYNEYEKSDDGLIGKRRPDPEFDMFVPTSFEAKRL